MTATTAKPHVAGRARPVLCGRPAGDHGCRAWPTIPTPSSWGRASTTLRASSVRRPALPRSTAPQARVRRAADGRGHDGHRHRRGAGRRLPDHHAYPRRLLLPGDEPDHQPGLQVPLHVRRAHELPDADPRRRRPQLGPGRAAFAEPAGDLRALSGLDRGHAVEQPGDPRHVSGRSSIAIPGR